MIIETLSVFPEMFDTVMSTSILGRAKASGLFQFHAYNPVSYTHLFVKRNLSTKDAQQDVVDMTA